MQTIIKAQQPLQIEEINVVRNNSLWNKRLQL
jgi:hypothetical protein